MATIFLVTRERLDYTQHARSAHLPTSAPTAEPDAQGRHQGEQHLCVVFVAALEDLRRKVDGRSKGVPLTVGVIVVTYLQQGPRAIAAVPFQEQGVQPQVSGCKPLAIRSKHTQPWSSIYHAS